MTPLAFDLLIFGLLLVSLIVGFMRGFTREFFGALGWLGAVIITIYGFYSLQPLLAPYIDIKWLLYLATALALFLPSYIFLRLISSWLSAHVKKSFLKSLDRILGALWGIGRGLVVLCLLFMITLTLAPQIVSSFADAKTLPWVQVTSRHLLSLLPPRFECEALEKQLRPPPGPTAEKQAHLLSSMRPRSTTGTLRHRPHPLYGKNDHPALSSILKKKVQDS